MPAATVDSDESALRSGVGAIILLLIYMLHDLIQQNPGSDRTSLGTGNAWFIYVYIINSITT